MTFLKSASLPILILLISGLGCFFNSTSLKGQVFDTQNKPLKDVTVKLYKFNPNDFENTEKQIETVLTNEKGEFKFKIQEIEEDYRYGADFIKEGYSPEFIQFSWIEVQKYSESFQNYRVGIKKRNE
jgi:5-hydroxyisourate hydrolase-like protein (transthyretin family)